MEQRAEQIAMKGRIFVLVLVLAAGAAAHAQTCPSKPVRLIVGAGLGSAGDVPARVVAAKLGEFWGHQMVVENRPGAGLTIAADIASRATPDGYASAMRRRADHQSCALQEAVMRPHQGFRSGVIAGNNAERVGGASFIARKNRSRVCELREANPGKINYGSSGVGTTLHLSMEIFRSMTGIEVVHVL